MSSLDQHIEELKKWSRTSIIWILCPYYKTNQTASLSFLFYVIVNIPELLLYTLHLLHLPIVIHMLGKGQVVLQRFPHFLLLVFQVGEEQVVARADDRVTLWQDYTHANLGFVLVVEFCSFEVLWLSIVRLLY